MSKTRKGVKITAISDHLKTWESYMPKDITKEDVKDWKKQHLDATMGGLLPIPKDVTYPGCYLGSRIRKEKLLPEHEIHDLLFMLGRQAFGDTKNQWSRVMEKYDEIKSL